MKKATYQSLLKIEIDRIEIGENKDYEGSNIDKNETYERLTSKESHINKLLSDFYNVDANNINIDIRENE